MTDVAPVTACIGLGGNVGDVADAFDRALAAMGRLPGTRVLRRSRIYRTPAWGLTGQADFLNAVVVLATGLPPASLLEALLAIERAEGRDRSATSLRWGPRRLDLDLLLYGDATIEQPGLVVPHPRLHERAFMLVPLAEVAGDAVVPGHGRVADLLSAVDAGGIVALETAAGDRALES